MTDPVVPPSAVAPANAPAAHPGKPPRKPGLLRWWGLILVLVLVIGTYAAIELLAAPAVANAIRTRLASRDLRLDDGTRVGVTILGGRAAIDALRIHDPQNGAVPYQADEVTVDVAVLETLGSGDLVIERLAGTGLAIDWRRRNGQVPGLPKDALPPDPAPQPGQTPQVIDWWSLWERSQEWRQRLEDWKPGERSEPVPPTPDERPRWEGARTYEPQGSATAPLPRVLIKTLALSGNAVALPDGAADRAGNPLDLTRFRAEGAMLALRRVAGEDQRLDADLAFAGAGSATLAWQRNDAGIDLRLGWRELPIAVLADRHVSGGRLAAYGPTGSASVAIDARSRDGRLDGRIRLDIYNLQLDPRPEAGAQAQQIARQLKELPVRHLPWELRLTGTLAAPRVEGFGPEGLAEALAKALGDAAKQRALQEGQKQLDKQLDRLKPEQRQQVDEAARQAKDKLGIDLPGLGR